MHAVQPAIPTCWRKSGSMNTARPNLRTACSWIPDQVRDDGTSRDQALARAVVRLFQVERRRGIGVAGLAAVAGARRWLLALLGDVAGDVELAGRFVGIRFRGAALVDRRSAA